MVSPRTDRPSAGEVAGAMGRVLAHFPMAALFLCLAAVPLWAAGIDKHIDSIRRGDFQRAIGDLQPLAKQGDPRAQYLLGTIYLNQYVDPPGPDEAARWIRLAAGQDFVPAQTELARMYRNGDGIARDPVKTAYWYGRAAENGDVGAQLFIADAHAYGIGLKRDRVQAYKWYQIAIRYWGPLAVRARDAVARDMTAIEIQRAEVLVAEWLRAKAKPVK